MSKSIHISLEEYQESLLAYHEEHQRMLHDRILRNADIMVVVLSFVFLFEITFIGGAFPDRVSGIDALRYVGSVSVLFWANLILVASCCILLTGANSMSSPWPVADDYFPEPALCTREASMAIRYGIMQATDECMQLVQDTMKAARWGIFAGISFGVVSVVAFMINGRLFDVLIASIMDFLPSGLSEIVVAGPIVMAIWLASDAIALGSCAYYYWRSTRALRQFRHEKQRDEVDSANGESSSGERRIVQVARRYQREFSERYGIAMRKEPNPLRGGNAWVSLSPECNLNCPHCYNKREDGTFSEGRMSLEELNDILLLLRGSSISSVIFTGGDPSVYPDLNKAVSLVKQYGMRCSFPTNGVLFSDEKKALELSETQIDSVTVSLKGVSEDVSGKYGASAVQTFALQGICNLTKHGVCVAASITLGGDNLEHVENMIEAAVSAGATAITLSPRFETEVSFGKRCESVLPPSSAAKVVTWVERHYDELAKTCGGNLYLEQTLPLCMWSQEFIENLAELRRARTVCQLYERSSVVIDFKGDLLLCNALHGYSVGSYGSDFDDPISLRDHMDSFSFREALASVTSPPSEKCQDCLLYSKCASGCATRWMVYSFADFAPYMKQWDFDSIALSDE